MKPSLKFALIAAIPVEAANSLFGGFPIDVGLPPDASVWVKVVAYQWLYMHYPGLMLVTSDYFEKLPQKVEEPLGYFILTISGYTETVFLFLMATFLFKILRRLAGNSATKAS